jgi:hypothetical protein
MRGREYVGILFLVVCTRHHVVCVVTFSAHLVHSADERDIGKDSPSGHLQLIIFFHLRCFSGMKSALVIGDRQDWRTVGVV